MGLRFRIAVLLLTLGVGLSQAQNKLDPCVVNSNLLYTCVFTGNEALLVGAAVPTPTLPTGRTVVDNLIIQNMPITAIPTTFPGTLYPSLQSLHFDKNQGSSTIGFGAIMSTPTNAYPSLLNFTITGSSNLILSDYALYRFTNLRNLTIQESSINANGLQIIFFNTQIFLITFIF